MYQQMYSALCVVCLLLAVQLLGHRKGMPLVGPCGQKHLTAYTLLSFIIYGSTIYGREVCRRGLE